MGWASELSAVGPFLEYLSEKYKKRSFGTCGQIIRVYIKDYVLQQILKFESFDIYKIIEQLCHYLRFQQYFFDDLNDGMVIAFKDGGIIGSLYKNHLPFGNFTLKFHTIFKVAKISYKFCPFVIELFDTARNLPFFYLEKVVHSSMS